MTTKRLDDLPFSYYHLKIVIALGVSWVLDGYEVTLMSVVATEIKRKHGLNNSQFGLIGSSYLFGLVLGCLFFAQKSNNYGRKSLYLITLGLYMISILLTSFSLNITMLVSGRMLTGVAVGGEYSSIFAAIDELIPALYRGRVDLLVDGSWHLGSSFASILGLIGVGQSPNSIIYLFLAGFVLAIPIFFIRSSIPESPRWLIAKGRLSEALLIIKEIEIKVYSETKSSIIPFISHASSRIEGSIEEDKSSKQVVIEFTFARFLNLFNTKYRTRFYLGLILMTSQAYFYNGIFYTFTICIEFFYKTPTEKAGIYLIPISIANILGVVLLSKYFDIWSRRKMISICYAASGIFLAITSFLFLSEMIALNSLMIFWFITFFIASPAASSAHLTVSEVFPISVRSQAMAFFYASGYLIGGVFSPFMFGLLINTEKRSSVHYSYISAAIIMIIAGVSAWYLGVNSEGKSLEEVSEELKDYEIDEESSYTVKAVQLTKSSTNLDKD